MPRRVGTCSGITGWGSLPTAKTGGWIVVVVGGGGEGERASSHQICRHTPPSQPLPWRRSPLDAHRLIIPKQGNDHERVCDAW
eukprot:1991965-Pyramimonas_sp.AAC.1